MTGKMSPCRTADRATTPLREGEGNRRGVAEHVTRGFRWWLAIAVLAVGCAEEHEPSTSSARMRSRTDAAPQGAAHDRTDASIDVDAARGMGADSALPTADVTPRVEADPVRAMVELERIERELDRRCTDDCTVLLLGASCSTSCFPAAVSPTTIADVERRLRQLEIARCDYRGDDVLLPSDCIPGDLVASCREGTCRLESSCPPGCTRVDGLCVDADAGRCDDCPRRQAIEDGAPCSSVGQSCYYPPSCGGDQATCEPSDGGLGRWFVATRLC